MNTKLLKKEIVENKLFIYPTDTIYGIGCNALNKKAVDKIRTLKGRDTRPFSVIAPSFEWIKKNCIVDVDLKKYLPGPYTIILKKKDPTFLKWVSDKDTIGIRMPDHPFTTKIQKSNVPFITTSINYSGEKHSSSIDYIPRTILQEVDVVIDVGTLEGNPSTLIIDGKEIMR